MKSSTVICIPRRAATQPTNRFGGAALFGGLIMLAVSAASAQTSLADQPLFSKNPVPGNVALALSVEFPTALSVAHLGDISPYTPSSEYLGYFDPKKCYDYHLEAVESPTKVSHFYPVGSAVGHVCSGKWSGNFMNWATMQTIDPFRWAMTGGYRRIDAPSETILERAYATGQLGAVEFPNLSLNSAYIAGATPTSLGALKMRNWGMGNKMRFTATGDVDAIPADSPASPYRGPPLDPATVYEVAVRVKVCERSWAVKLEGNCRRYGRNFKPEGLMQKYSNQMLFSVFGYLNHSGDDRDGGVLRAPQKFIGPGQFIPGRPSTPNPFKEWDPRTGVFITDPDRVSTALGTPISNSGAMNYLNKFGQITPGEYKEADPVGELYYAALRYFKDMGNVPEWTHASVDPVVNAKWADGFPVFETWNDPILRDPARFDTDNPIPAERGKKRPFYCQKHFVLGIGDTNSHADKNVPGPTSPLTEPPKPATVNADTTVNAVDATNKVGVMQGLGPSLGNAVGYGPCCLNNSVLMAGLAYDAHIKDIRPGVVDVQTVDTFWIDVLEWREYRKDNVYYLASKYGGFKVPHGYDPNNTTPLQRSWWSTTGETVGDSGNTQDRPDNFFTGGKPETLVKGLKKAFAKMSSQLSFSTAFATPNPQIALSGNASFGAVYDASDWTGDVVASELSFNPLTGQPIVATRWKFSDKLARQAAADPDWWKTGRRIATWNSRGVAFRHPNLSSDQKNALNTPYDSSNPNDGADFLNYLRGDTSREEAKGGFYRNRTSLVGDIVGSKVNPVSAPSFPYSDTPNPGYSDFRTLWATRPPVVYAGSNGGMMHAIDGSLNDGITPAIDGTHTGGGKELFAYVPGVLFKGPTRRPHEAGLVALGNPLLEHHYYVNATPGTYDIDFDWTHPLPSSRNPDWHTMLIGGLGKGGKSYYAIDVTDPHSMVRGGEGAVAGKVRWEFTHSDLGFTYGDPAVVKTKQYGWVAILPSGYNRAAGRSCLFIVHAYSGVALQRICTPPGIPSVGLAHVNTYVNDRTDGTADAAYAGDLQGNIWRLDLTPDPGNYTFTRIAFLGQPVTSRARIEIERSTNKRFVLVGTGKLLHDDDSTDGQEQSFYAIADGTPRRFNSAAELPRPVTFPIKRANLVPNTNLLTGITTPPANSMGWYHDLGKEAGVGWRVLMEPTPFYGTVAFSAMLPSDDMCKPGGISRVYSIDFGTGKTILNNSDGTLAKYFSVDTNVTDIAIVSIDGKPALLVGDGKGRKHRPPTTVPTAGLNQINWREQSLVD